MEFRRAFQVPPIGDQMNIRDRILLVGSCFTDHLGKKLQHHRFSTMQNPHGILFNPVSIAKAITSYTEGHKYSSDELFFHQEWWTSWDHHTQFSDANQENLLQMINTAQAEAHQYLKQAKWLIITLGSSWVYQLPGGQVVANCHKIPTDKFHKKLMPVEDVLSVMDNMIHRLFRFNPDLRILFTISPVRHLRDGFVENNRSKAVLIQAVHHLVEKFNQLFYFPAYELIIDDLRDYRFYAEDMVHPNYLATSYVWEKFTDACIDEESRRFMKEISTINAAHAHKPFQPLSNAHRLFRLKQVEKISQLSEAYPFIDFTQDLAFFTD